MSALHRKLFLAGWNDRRRFRLESAFGSVEKLVRLAVLGCFYHAVVPAGPDHGRALCYIIVAIGVESMVQIELIDLVGGKAATGESAYFAMRPGTWPAHLFCFCMGRKAAPLAAGAALTLLAPVLPGSPVAPPDCLLFLVSVALSLPILYLVQLLFALVTFRTLNVWGAKLLYLACFHLLSGVMIPREWLPAALAAAAACLPFDAAVGVPARTLLGAGPAGLPVQAAWLALLAPLAGALARAASRRAAVIGG